MFKGLRENAKIVIISAVTSLLFSTGGFAIANTWVTGADIKDETITNKDIANFTIGYKKLRSSSVNTYKIANYSIQGIDVKNRSIPLNKLTANVAPANHTHAPVAHSHAYAPTTHNHDSRYYTGTEVNSQIDGLEAYVNTIDDLLWANSDSLEAYVNDMDDLIFWYVDSLHGLLGSAGLQAIKAEAESLRDSRQSELQSLQQR